jgi:Rod binding domain-containing protein
MSLDSISASSPAMSIGLLSSSASITGATPMEKLKSACKAVEGLFAGQLLSEIGQGIDGKDDATGGQYQDFIQQALAQQVTSGGGFGLAKMLEKSLAPSVHPSLNPLHQLHASTNLHSPR